MADDKVQTFDIPKTCKGGVVVNEGPDFHVEVQDVPTPEPGPTDVLIKLNATGICHSDIHFMLNDWALPKMSEMGTKCAGHEGAGVIVQVGAQVKKLKPGMRAGFKPIQDTCGVCELCRGGQECYCAGAVFTGLMCDGSYKQYVVSPERYTTIIPDGVNDYIAGPIMCSASTIYTSIKESDLKPGDWAVFPGAGGGVGMQGVQLAKAMGLRAVAIDTGADKEKLCKDVGAEEFIDFKKVENVAEEIIRICDGIGAHGVFVTAVQTYPSSVSYLGGRVGGKVMCIGLPPAGTQHIDVDPNQMCFKKQSIHGTLVSSMADVDKTLDFAKRGLLKPIYTVYPLSKFDEAVQKLRRGEIAGRAVVDFNQEQCIRHDVWMMRRLTSSASQSPHAHAEASSSRPPSGRTAPGKQPAVEDDHSDEEALLADDPLNPSLSEQISFKRKPKPTPSSILPRFFAGPSTSPRNTPSPRTQQSRRPATTNAPDDGATELILNYLDTPADAGAHLADAKDAAGLDWYVEGPGRRVGYDDLTAIDWIFEYAQERQRLRHLYSSATGLLGSVKQLADASQVWIILVAAGVLSGGIAAFIDVASDWLADLKTGYCSSVEGDGRFYLNRGFCCWGIDTGDQCADWQEWGVAMGIGSVGGKWIVEYIFFILFSVFFAACASLLVREFSPYARHSGIPEIKTVLGGFVIRHFLGGWTLVTKTLGLCLAVASGLWLGKEGPLVHVACCSANLFMKLFGNVNGNEARKREVLSAAAAAGISVAFGAPVGGVLFSLEQLSYYFPDKTMWSSFVCAMVAAVTLQAFNPFRTGKLVLYQVTYHSGWHDFELVPFALLGIIGGLYGGLFIKLNMAIASWRQDRTYLKGPVTEVVIISFVTALINFPIKFMRAQASELVYILFAECADLTEDTLGLCKSGKANTGVIALLLISALLGILLAAFTFGLQIPAGIILPSMAIGGLYGRAVGLSVQVFQTAFSHLFIFGSCEPDVKCVTPGTYAIVGAASALAGTTRMTVSIVVIMFELTGALTYVLPIMIAVMISKWIGDAISPRGIYESWIHFKGYPFLDNRDDNGSSIPDVPAAHVMTRIEDLTTISATGHTIQSLRQMLQTHRYRGFPVISPPSEHDSSPASSDALLLGYISRTELLYALSLTISKSLPQETECHFAHQPLADPSSSLDLRPWMDQTPITLNARASFQLTVSMFQKLGLRYVLFTDKGMLRGLLTKKDVWYVLNGMEDEAWDESEEYGDAGGGGGVRRGGLREEREGVAEGSEERGLLGTPGDEDHEGSFLGSDSESESGK
ncbi:chloride channel [Boeremia exigua]|uniref:chloride channel n=1 Tax=Boeremia exigua TaxID=749465 RepID=UPI001E8EA215|nr:chloride channel [Boeremia exigua]KAH6625683.1 chloride channel [Boeremia exigua]